VQRSPRQRPNAVPCSHSAGHQPPAWPSRSNLGRDTHRCTDGLCRIQAVGCARRPATRRGRTASKLTSGRHRAATSRSAVADESTALPAASTSRTAAFEDKTNALVLGLGPSGAAGGAACDAWAYFGITLPESITLRQERPFDSSDVRTASARYPSTRSNTRCVIASPCSAASLKHVPLVAKRVGRELDAFGDGQRPARTT
jgi:hypothetical protein